MANLAVTNTFVAATTASASQVNTNFSDVVTYINNRNSGSATWDSLKVSATSSNPVDFSSSSAGSTEVSINNSASDGDPLLTFKLSGTQTHVIGVDDSDSDFFKFATTGLTTNVAFQIPTTGAQAQFASGSVSLPGQSFISATNTGTYLTGASPTDTINWACRGVQVAASNSANFFIQVPLDLTSAGFIKGTVGTPGINFTGGLTTGFYLTGSSPTESLNAACRGVNIWSSNSAQVSFTPNIVPATDNTVTCGASGARWTEIWAVNGAIQTSVLSSKKNVTEVSEQEIMIPQAIKFNRLGDDHLSRQFGFVADGLPEECFAVIDEQGNRSSTSVYTSSIIGMLCAAFKSLDNRVKILEI